MATLEYMMAMAKVAIMTILAILAAMAMANGRYKVAIMAHWGSPFINLQGRKEGRSCFQLHSWSQTNMKSLKCSVYKGKVCNFG